ncbi:hypothetical protein EJB05_14988, partial [Eragrostis curvula]
MESFSRRFNLHAGAQPRGLRRIRCGGHCRLSSSLIDYRPDPTRSFFDGSLKLQMSSDEEATSSAEGPSPPPCAGCKHLRRRCVPSCPFAAYFPPEHGDQFAAVHKARARLRDPAFGCVSYITVLEHMLKQGMGDLAAARGQLADRDERMRAVRVAFEAKRKEGRAEAWKDAVRRGEGQPLLNRQMAEAQQAAAVAQSARKQAVKMQQHAGTELGFPDGHVSIWLRRQGRRLLHRPRGNGQ